MSFNKALQLSFIIFIVLVGVMIGFSWSDKRPADYLTIGFPLTFYSLKDAPKFFIENLILDLVIIYFVSLIISCIIYGIKR